MVPLFVRAGAVLPMTEAQQFVGEKPRAPLILHLYPGSGVSWLYEDDGESLAYRAGDFRLTRFEMKREGEEFLLERIVEGDFLPRYDKISIIFHSPPISSVLLDEARVLVLNNHLQIDPDCWQRIRFAIG